VFGFADWLVGLAAQQPRQFRRITRIRKQIYTSIARLDAELIASPEPIPFAELDRDGEVRLVVDVGLVDGAGDVVAEMVSRWVVRQEP